MFDSNKLSRTKESHHRVNTKHKFILVLIFFTFSFQNTKANSPLTIDAKVDKPLATTGDIITYTITLRHDADLKPSMPDFSVIDGFDVYGELANKPLIIEDQIFIRSVLLSPEHNINIF